MAVILTGTEYIDLNAHGVALDVRQRPITLYVEFSSTQISSVMFLLSHGRVSSVGDQEWAILWVGNEQINSRWRGDGQSVTSVVGPGTMDGNLHRVAIVIRSSVDTMVQVIDGVSGTSGSTPTTLTTANINDTTAIGRDADADQFYFIGQVQNVAIWDTELTTAEAEGLTAGTITPLDLPTGLRAFWPLDFDARDESGNNLDGTAVGSPAFTEQPPAGQAEGVTLTVVANNAASSIAVNAGSADLTMAAENAATVLHSQPDAAEATLTMAAQDATVDLLAGLTEANAEAALLTVEATDAGVNVAFIPNEELGSQRASFFFSAEDATISASADVSAGSGNFTIAALDAIVEVSGNVTPDAQIAAFGMAAQDPAISASSNVSAEAATISFAAQDLNHHAFAGAAEFTITARSAAASIAEGTLANAEQAEFSIAAFNATVTVSGEVITASAQVADITLTAFDAIALGVEPPPPTYTFFPPTIEENLTYDDPFLQRLYWERGLSVVKKSGEFVTVRYVVPENLDGQTEGVHYFVGGHHYSAIPETVALELIAAGYTPELEPA